VSVCQVLAIFDYFFTTVFTIEIVVKVCWSSCTL